MLWLRIVLGNTNDLLFYIQKEYKQLVCTLFNFKETIQVKNFLEDIWYYSKL